MTKIVTAYNPDECINEWGWLWWVEPEAEGEWVLVNTFTDDDDALRTAVMDRDGMSLDARGEWDSERLRGQPYLSLYAPACDPDAGLLVTIRLPNGASMAYSVAAGDKADRTRDAVMAAINGSIGDERA
jgi:hypothetical protein